MPLLHHAAGHDPDRESPLLRRDNLRYPSALTDTEWRLVEPLIPPAKRDGGKRTVNMRQGVNGVLVRPEHWLPVAAYNPAIARGSHGGGSRGGGWHDGGWHDGGWHRPLARRRLAQAPLCVHCLARPIIGCPFVRPLYSAALPPCPRNEVENARPTHCRPTILSPDNGCVGLMHLDRHVAAAAACARMSSCCARTPRCRCSASATRIGRTASRARC
jgi:transposase